MAEIGVLPELRDEEYWIGQYPDILSARRFRAARQAGAVKAIPRKRGYAYTAEQINDVLNWLAEKACQKNASKSASGISIKSPEATVGTATVTTLFQDESLAKASAARIKKRRS